MHTSHESNHTLIKLPHNENSRPRRKNNKKQFSLYKLSNATNGWMPLVIFTQIFYPYIDKRQGRTNDIPNILQKVSAFGIVHYQF